MKISNARVPSLLLSFSALAACKPTLVAQTTSGTLNGFNSRPNVNAFLGIPFAQPPVGDLRFAPPQPFVGNGTIDCFTSSPGCFQQQILTAFSDRATGWAESEDMLSINIWTPAEFNGTLPVMIFLYGGGFTEGANGMSNYDGTSFVSEQQNVIFATINYRVNVFGFPNSAAIKTKNVGLLDQRLGVEWLRDNIGAFGGDATRMTLSGQSAGSMSASYWSYAYADDPIVSGFIEFSGQPGLVSNDDGSSWTAIANATGCANAADPDAELACLRQIPARDLKRAINPNNTPTISDPSTVSGGTPAVDNVTVFSVADYATLGAAGKFAKVPLLVANTMNEGDGILPYTPTAGVNTTLSDELTLALFHCPAAATAGYWDSQGVPTYRYLYNGTWAETFPYSWMRPYHGSDQPLVFALEKAYGYQAIGSEILKAGNYLRQAIAAFVQDPSAGLQKYGWPMYSQNASTIVNLFGNNSADVSFLQPASFDQLCQYL